MDRLRRFPGSIPVALRVLGRQRSARACIPDLRALALVILAACGASEAPTEVGVNAELEVSTTSLPDGVENELYGPEILTATGGDGSYTWSLTSGSLPSGLDLAAGGAITGTPTDAGTHDFTVRVVSGDGQIAERALSLHVIAVSFDCGSVTSIPIEECEALVALYLSTDGDNWKNNDAWLQTEEPCGWFGVSCFGGGSVRDLVLADNGLVGTIPPELGNLSNLDEQLVLSRNQLTGAIPPELGKLTALELLFLGFNQLTGPIPPELGNLSNLDQLSLRSNRLSGPIPSELGSLVKLRYLAMDSNELAGTVPLSVAVLGEGITCRLESNSHLTMPNTAAYQGADVDGDGFICGIPLT